jgi:hypothetical protein
MAAECSNSATGVVPPGTAKPAAFGYIFPKEATMRQRLRKVLVDFWIVLAFGLAAALVMPQANAGLIATDDANAQDERARVKALIERPELGKELAKMGIAPHEAAARVDAMADGEVLQLAGRLDAALAGGQLSNQNLLLIIIVILLIILIL